VVRSAGSTVYNYANPVRCFLPNIGVAGDNVTVRFTTDNAGPWFLHYHVDWHLETSLTQVCVSSLSRSRLLNRITAAWDNLCPAYNALGASEL
ncbi:hypothetical protein B0H16DRAFT_1852089, partial [Mycena metata]